MSDKQSDAFEAWLLTRGWTAPPARGESGKYINVSVQARWLAWQAALVAQAQPAAVPVAPAMWVNPVELERLQQDGARVLNGAAYQVNEMRLPLYTQPAAVSTKAQRVHALVNDGPWPGMSEAFDAYMGADCWTDPAYRPDAATWAAAWKAGQRAQTAAAVPAPAVPEQIDRLRGLDTANRVRFYEHDFYVLSNFSAFTLQWQGCRFDTSEAAYHYEKFPDRHDIGAEILHAPSAHEAFKVAERNKGHRRADWDQVKVGIMLDILRAKATQHEYVRRKLLATGDRELVEDSWRDDFWGWGPERTGRNMLGNLWMQVRAELRAAATADPLPTGERA